MKNYIVLMVIVLTHSLTFAQENSLGIPNNLKSSPWAQQLQKNKNCDEARKDIERYYLWLESYGDLSEFTRLSESIRNGHEPLKKPFSGNGAYFDLRNPLSEIAVILLDFETHTGGFPNQNRKDRVDNYLSKLESADNENSFFVTRSSAVRQMDNKIRSIADQMDLTIKSAKVSFSECLSRLDSSNQGNRDNGHSHNKKQ